MKILHASLTREFAGSEMYCASLARAQAEQGDDVRVVVRTTPYVARWKREAGKAEVIALPWWVPGFAESWVIARIIKGFEPEVVHTHLGRADVKVGRVAKRMKLPWVTTVHLRWKPEVMAAADAAVCIAGWQVKDLEASGFQGRIATIWNWLPRQNVAASEKVAALRASWGAGQQTIVFGSVGRLHGQKGMDVLVRAFLKAYPDPKEDVRLVIVGEGVDRAKLQNLIGTEKRIVLAGYQDDTSGYYEAFDAYVSASRYEPFGLTILEAMAHGCQLICTRTEGPSEFLQDASAHGQVLWAERGNVDSLAAVLKVAQVQGRGHITYDLRPFAVEKAVGWIGSVYGDVVGREG